MGEVVPFRSRRPARFGSCPECGRISGVVNIGKAHWFYCDRHRTKWIGGFGLFRSWLRENPSLWLENSRRLADYREVEPLRWRWREAGPKS